MKCVGLGLERGDHLLHGRRSTWPSFVYLILATRCDDWTGLGSDLRSIWLSRTVREVVVVASVIPVNHEHG